MPARTAVLAVLLAVLATGCKNTDHPSAATNSAPAPTSVATPTPSTPPTTPPSAPSATPTPTPTVDIGKLSAAQIVAKTQAAAKAAKSLRVKGSVSDDDGSRIGMDLRLTTASGSGSLTVKGDTLSLIVLGRAIYVRASDSFLRHQAKSKAEGNAVVQLINGRWIRTTAKNKDLQDLAAVADKTGFYDALFEPTGTARKAGLKVVDGVRCVGIGDSTGTLWVDRATAQPVRIDSGSDVLHFSEYNRTATPKAPPANQVIDGDALDAL